MLFSSTFSKLILPPIFFSFLSSKIYECSFGSALGYSDLDLINGREVLKSEFQGYAE